MAGHNAGSRKGKTQRIMRSFKIDEISAVDLPAQEGARAVIMKRDDGSTSHQTDGKIEKRAWLTTDVDGHAHLVDDRNYDDVKRDGGDTSWSVSDNDKENRGHSHPWIENIDGSITIGASEGHTHEVLETTIKLAPGRGSSGTLEDPMPKEVKKIETETENKDESAAALKAATDRTAELETQLTEANARAEMTDAQRAHFDAIDPQLDDVARKAFAEAKPAAREAIVQKIKKEAEDAKGVAYKADDGTEYTRADDPRLTAQAKRNDELAKDLAKATKRADEQDLRKRAEDDLKHLPGTVETRMALLKATDSISDDDERKSAQEALKAQNELLGKAFKTLGAAGKSGRVDADADEDNADGKLDKLAKAHAKEHNVTEAEGYTAVLETEEGATLYGELTGDPQYVS